MKNILHIISSPRGSESVSIQLGNAVVKQLEETYPGSNVATLNLAENPLPHLDEATITALRTPADQQTDIQKDILKASDAALVQLFDTDIFVIGVPLYNLGIPSNLKSWLDHIMRAGKTFNYGPEGAKGYVTGKKVYLAFSAGAIYSEGALQGYDFATPYLTAALGFIGMTDVTVVRAEGLGIPGLKETALERALEAFAV